MIEWVAIGAIGSALGVERSSGRGDDDRGKTGRHKAVIPDTGPRMVGVLVRDNVPFSATPDLFHAILDPDKAKEAVQILGRLGSNRPGELCLSMKSAGRVLSSHEHEHTWSVTISRGGENRLRAQQIFIDIEITFDIKGTRYDEGDVLTAIQIVRRVERGFHRMNVPVFLNPFAMRVRGHLLGESEEELVEKLNVGFDGFPLFRPEDQPSAVQILQAVSRRFDQLTDIAREVHERFVATDDFPVTVEIP